MRDGWASIGVGSGGGVFLQNISFLPKCRQRKRGGVGGENHFSTYGTEGGGEGGAGKRRGMFLFLAGGERGGGGVMHQNM